MMMAEKAVLYMRVSTSKQNQANSYSLDMQHTFGQQYCFERSIEIVQEFKEIGSGAKSDRPKFQAMLGLVRQEEVTMIVCYKYSRLARNVEAFLNLMQTCVNHNVRVVSVTEPTSGSHSTQQFQASVYAILAEFERETIRDNQRQSYFQKMMLGEPLSTSVPFGYRWDEKSKRPIVFKEEAMVVKQVYELYLVGYGYRRIGQIFGLSSQLIRKILTNERYMGLDKNIYGVAKFPAIVDPSQFEKVNQLRLAKTVNSKRILNGTILKHKIACPICGRFLTCERHERGDRVYKYMSCGNRNHTSFRINQNSIEAQVQNEIRIVINSVSVDNAIVKTIKQSATNSEIEKDPVRAYLKQQITKAEMKEQLDNKQGCPSAKAVIAWLRSDIGQAIVQNTMMQQLQQIIINQDRKITNVFLSIDKNIIDLNNIKVG